MGWLLAPNDAVAQDGEMVHGRVVALRHDDGAVEFGFQPQDNPRILPEQRWLPADATIGRWLRSGPVVQAGLELGRINARQLSNGRIEFGFTPAGGERLLPRARFLRTDSETNLWLRSSSITFQVRPADPRATIVEVLFPGQSASQINYDYNNWGPSLTGYGDSCDGYRGGHSGWDVQTKSVAGAATANVAFHSLTNGEVTAIGGTLGKIAVYDADTDRTTVYLHARRIDVSVGQRVSVGTRLGIQGNFGLSSDPTVSEHVHIEVRTGRRISAACGATGTINPIDHLHRSVAGR